MRKSKMLTAAALGALAVPAAADAHVTLQPNEIPAGGFARLNVRVPNERDNAGTRKVVVQFPDGFATASYEAVPGWRIRVKKEKIDTPLDLHGEKVNEQINTVSFTATDGDAVIAPGQFRDFGLSMAIPEKPGQALVFKAIQTYEGGEVVRWIGPEDSEEPAPIVTLQAAEGGHGAAKEDEAAEAEGSRAAPEADAEEEEDDGAPAGVAWAGLALGGLGLLAGGSALLRTRRNGS